MYGRGNITRKREGIIVPIYKREDKDVLGNYKGVTLLNTAYKIFAETLNERIIKEVESKGGWEENQAEFKKGRGCMDNIYVLRSAIEKEIKMKGGVVFGLFLDLEAAFDNLDREVLWKCMEKIGVRVNIERVKVIYEETRVRIGEKLTGEFWVEKGVEAGMPIEPDSLQYLCG